MTLDDPWLLVRAWLLAPALVALASAGIGLLVGRLSGVRLGALTLPIGCLAGIALFTVVLQLRLTVGGPAVVGLALLAVAGAVAEVVWRRRDARPPGRAGRGWPWAAAAALATFGLFMAPLAGSGGSGVVGYVLNNDVAVHLAAVELLRDFGPVGQAPPASSYDVVSGNFDADYPIGSYAWPLFASVLTGTDPFHQWTPLIALTAALLALTGHAILRRTGAGPALAGIGGGVAACSYLVYSYAAQGGAKEVAAMLGVYASIAGFAAAEDRHYDWRALLPAVLGTAGGVAIFSVAELAWLGPAALAAIAVLLAHRLRRPGRLPLLRDLAVAVGVFALLTVPSLVAGQRFVEVSSEEVLHDVGEAGNLLAPLKWIEAFGVWLIKDYRYPTTDNDLLTGIGIGIAAALGIVGVLHALRRGRFAVPICVLAGFAAVGLVVVRGRHGIYIDAKVYALLAPALGLAAAAGVAALARGRRALRVLGAVAGLALAVGVVASDLLVYSGAWLTPRERFGELLSLGERYAGQGPVLVNEREDYAKHLLRDAAPWMSWDSYQPEKGLRDDGARLDLTHAPDFDDYTLEFYERFPLLLERKRPGGSRPPGNYEPVEETTRYRVWRRTGPHPAAHLPLGGTEAVSGTARLDCSGADFRRLRSQARRTGRPLRVSRRPETVVVPQSRWRTDAAEVPGPQRGYVFRLGGSAVIEATLAPGRWRAWIQGSVGPGQRLSVLPDGARRPRPQDQIGEVRSDLGLQDGYHTFGEVDVDGGRARFSLLGLAKPWWQSGSTRYDLIGPVVFEPAGAAAQVSEVDAREARSLCGRRLDWVEVG